MGTYRMACAAAAVALAAASLAACGGSSGAPSPFTLYPAALGGIHGT